MHFFSKPPKDVQRIILILPSQASEKEDLFEETCILTDTGEESKLVYRRKRPIVDTLFSSLFSDASERRDCMIQRRVENTRVHFWTIPPVSVKALTVQKI